MRQISFSHPAKKAPLVSTYSIVAYDPESGELGVAVQSHYFGVSTVVPWAEYGVGAVATQSLSEITYGPLGLELMRSGKTAKEALAGLLASDENSAVRQVAMIDTKGNVAAHTGEKCIAEAGHKTGENYSVQANLMLRNTVWDAMAKAYEETKGDLTEKMMTVLEAAEAEGGDIRGKQSVSILVVDEKHKGTSSSAPLFDLHIDDHPQPLPEMRRLLRIARAYRHAGKSGELLNPETFDEKKLKQANEEFAKARELLPPEENPELLFWHAVELVTAGRVEDALPHFKEVFAINPIWKELVPRLVPSELFPDDKEILEKVASLT